jgi:Contractile injection system tape measure protein
MEGQAHSIQALEINFLLKGKLARQQRPIDISEELQARITAAIEAELDRVCPADQTIFLEKLELRTDDLNWSDFEEEFPASIQMALRSALQAQQLEMRPSPSDAPRAPQYASEADAQLQALLHFLQHGSLPWWFELQPGERPSALIAAAWRLRPAAFVQWLQAHRHELHLLQRLAHRSAPEDLPLLIGALAPGVGAAQYQMLSQLADALASPAGALTAAQWLPKIYAAWIAQVLRTDFVVARPQALLLQTVWELRPMLRGPQMARLQATFPSLAGLQALAASSVPTSAISPPQLRQRTRAVVQYFLRNNSLPPWVSAFTASELAQHLGRLLSEAPQELLPILNRAIELPYFGGVLAEALQIYLVSEFAKGKPLALLQRITQFPAGLRHHPRLGELLDRVLGLLRQLLWLDDAFLQQGEAYARTLLWELPPEMQALGAAFLQQRGKPLDSHYIVPLLEHISQPILHPKQEDAVHSMDADGIENGKRQVVQEHVEMSAVSEELASAESLQKQLKIWTLALHAGDARALYAHLDALPDAFQFSAIWAPAIAVLRNLATLHIWIAALPAGSHLEMAASLALPPPLQAFSTKWVRGERLSLSQLEAEIALAIRAETAAPTSQLPENLAIWATASLQMTSFAAANPALVSVILPQTNTDSIFETALEKDAPIIPALLESESDPLATAQIEGAGDFLSKRGRESLPGIEPSTGLEVEASPKSETETLASSEGFFQPEKPDRLHHNRSSDEKRLPSNPGLAGLLWFLEHGALPAWAPNLTADDLLATFLIEFAKSNWVLEERILMALDRAPQNSWIVSAWDALGVQMLSERSFARLLRRISALPPRLRHHAQLQSRVATLVAVAQVLVWVDECIAVQDLEALHASFWRFLPGMQGLVTYFLQPTNSVLDPRMLAQLLALVESESVPEGLPEVVQNIASQATFQPSSMTLRASVLRFLETGIFPASSNISTAEISEDIASLMATNVATMWESLLRGMQVHAHSAIFEAAWVQYFDGLLATQSFDAMRVVLARVPEGIRNISQYRTLFEAYSQLFHFLEWMDAVSTMRGTLAMQQLFWELPWVLQPIATLKIEAGARPLALTQLRPLTTIFRNHLRDGSQVLEALLADDFAEGNVALGGSIDVGDEARNPKTASLIHLQAADLVHFWLVHARLPKWAGPISATEFRQLLAEILADPQGQWRRFLMPATMHSSVIEELRYVLIAKRLPQSAIAMLTQLLAGQKPRVMDSQEEPFEPDLPAASWPPTRFDGSLDEVSAWLWFLEKGSPPPWLAHPDQVLAPESFLQHFVRGSQNWLPVLYMAMRQKFETARITQALRDKWGRLLAARSAALLLLEIADFPPQVRWSNDYSEVFTFYIAISQAILGAQESIIISDGVEGFQANDKVDAATPLASTSPKYFDGVVHLFQENVDREIALPQLAAALAHAEDAARLAQEGSVDGPQMARRTARLGQSREQGFLLWFLENGSLPPWAPALDAAMLISLLRKEILAGNPRIVSHLHLALVRDQNLDIVVPSLLQALVHLLQVRELVALASLIASFPGHLRRKAILKPIFALFESFVAWLEARKQGQIGPEEDSIPQEVCEILLTEDVPHSLSVFDSLYEAIVAFLRQHGLSENVFIPSEIVQDQPAIQSRTTTLPTTYYVDVVRYFLLRQAWPWWGAPAQLRSLISRTGVGDSVAETFGLQLESALHSPSTHHFPGSDDYKTFKQLLAFVEGEFATSMGRELDKLLRGSALRDKILNQISLPLLTPIVRMLLRPVIVDVPHLINLVLEGLEQQFAHIFSLPALQIELMEYLVAAYFKKQLGTPFEILRSLLARTSALVDISPIVLAQRLPMDALITPELREAADSLSITSFVEPSRRPILQADIWAQMRFYFVHGYVPLAKGSMRWDVVSALVQDAVKQEDILTLKSIFFPRLAGILLRIFTSESIARDVVEVLSRFGILVDWSLNEPLPSAEILRWHLPDLGETTLQTFLYFLKQGRLPEWSVFESVSVLQNGVTQYIAGSDGEAKLDLLMAKLAEDGIVAQADALIGLADLSILGKSEIYLEDAAQRSLTMSAADFQVAMKEEIAAQRTTISNDEEGSEADISEVDAVDEGDATGYEDYTISAEKGLTFDTEFKPLDELPSVNNELTLNKIQEGSQEKSEVGSDENGEFSDWMEYTLTADGLVTDIVVMPSDEQLVLEANSPTNLGELGADLGSENNDPDVVDMDLIAENIEDDRSLLREKTQNLIQALRLDGALMEKYVGKDLSDWAASQEKLRQQEELKRNRAAEMENQLVDERAGIPIQNAGLVILWPFLSRHFRQLGLMEKGQWRDEIAQMRGVFLLQYLVEFEEWDAENEPSEHLLMLNKLLCGLSPESLVTLDGPLTDLEKEYSELLLKAAMQNWKAMANTSVQGFQRSFLFREGLLSRQGDNWNLKVSVRGYDQILAQLDWGLAVIKLPYNNYLIYTEWI